MSKPDSTGDSLESILASIRKSLSEQSTDVLEEGAVAPADADPEAKSASPRKDGLTQRLAGTAADAPGATAPLAEKGDPPERDLSGPVAEATPAAASPPGEPSPPPAATSAATTRKDPLWFLSRRGEAAATEDGQRKPADATQAVAAAAASKPPQAEAKAAGAGIVRGPLPPFFGSSAEAAKVEVMQPGVGVMLPPVREATRVPAGSEEKSARNGKANGLFGHAAPDKLDPERDNPHVHALEVMVSDLLRPMLRRWLDENMPRLVSAALKDEAARMSERDAKKP